jgi:hypothetical protein
MCLEIQYIRIIHTLYDPPPINIEMSTKFPDSSSNITGLTDVQALRAKELKFQKEIRKLPKKKGNLEDNYTLAI